MSSDSELNAFFESSNRDKDIDVVYSQYTPYRTAITIIRHQDILAARFEDHF